MHDQPGAQQPPHGSNQQPGDPAQVPGTGGSSHRTLVITLAVCVCLVVAGVLAAVLSSGGGRPRPSAAGGAGSAVTGTPAPRPAAQTSSPPASPHPSTEGKGIAKSALTPAPRLNHKVARWAAGPGGRALAVVEEQMGSAMQAAGVKLYHPMKQTCISLASDVGSAQAAPPIPDQAMQRLYASALAGLSHAAADCRTAISSLATGDETVQTHVNQALLTRARVEFAMMSKRLYRATATIR